MVAMVFFVALWATVDMSFWGVDAMAATTVAVNGTHIAVAAQGDPTKPLPANFSYTASRNVFNVVGQPLRQALLGTPVNWLQTNGNCETPQQVLTRNGGRPGVEVCAHLNAATGFVTVRISGYALAPVPIPWRSGGIPIDSMAVAHVLAFAR
jgi:hypothetical protein